MSQTEAAHQPPQHRMPAAAAPPAGGGCAAARDRRRTSSSSHRRGGAAQAVVGEEPCGGRIEAAIRRAGAVVAAASASALMHSPAAGYVSLALHVLFLLGCAAVQLAPAHRAVAALARRAAEAARARGVALGASAAGLRRAGLAGILLYALHEAADVRTEAAASFDKVVAFLLFLVFLAAVWAVYLSMVTGRVAPAPRPAAAAEDDVGDLNASACTCPC